MTLNGVDAVDLVLVGVGLVAPILVAAGIAGWLKSLARRASQVSGVAPAETIASIFRWPVVFAGVLAGLYLSSLWARELSVELLRNRNWPLFERWLIAAAVLLAFYVGYRLAVSAFRFAARRANRDPRDFFFISKLTAAVISAIAAVTALNLLGVNIGPVLASLGVAGIAVALALQDTLGNYFASLSITVDKALKPGDYIRLESGHEGFVEAVGWRTTRIRPYGETMLIVPNSKLTSSIVTNFYLPENSVRVYIDFGVGYEENLEEVEEVLIETAKETIHRVPGADTEFEPIVRFKEFADSNIAGTLTLRASDFEMSFRLKHECIKAIHRKFAEKGIAINYPVRQIVPMVVDTGPKYPPPDVPRDVI